MRSSRTSSATSCMRDAPGAISGCATPALDRKQHATGFDIRRRSAHARAGRYRPALARLDRKGAATAKWRRIGRHLAIDRPDRHQCPCGARSASHGQAGRWKRADRNGDGARLRARFGCAAGGRARFAVGHHRRFRRLAGRAIGLRDWQSPLHRRRTAHWNRSCFRSRHRHFRAALGRGRYRVASRLFGWPAQRCRWASDRRQQHGGPGRTWFRGAEQDRRGLSQRSAGTGRRLQPRTTIGASRAPPHCQVVRTERRLRQQSSSLLTREVKANQPSRAVICCEGLRTGKRPVRDPAAPFSLRLCLIGVAIFSLNFHNYNLLFATGGPLFPVAPQQNRVVIGAGTVVNLPNPRTGPVFTIAHSILASRKEYQSFLGGGSRGDFSVFLDSIAPELIAAGLPPDDVQFAKRYPQSQPAFVGDTLRSLARVGILPRPDYDETGYERVAAQIGENYDHGPFRTYI